MEGGLDEVDGVKRGLWFVGLWLAGVVVLAVVAGLLRLVMGL